MQEIGATKRIRQNVRTDRLLYFHPPVNPDPELDEQIFYDFLKEHFPLGRTELESRISMDLPIVEVQMFCSGFFALSLGFLTYGHLEAAESIIKCMPFISFNGRRFANMSLHTLIPFPTGISPYHNPDKAIEWLKEHASRLRWDNTIEKFELDSN